MSAVAGGAGSVSVSCLLTACVLASCAMACCLLIFERMTCQKTADAALKRAARAQICGQWIGRPILLWRDV